MELMEEFKQTDLGLICSDWSIVEFQEVMEGFSSGQTPYRGNPEFFRGDIPWITSGELNFNIVVDTNEKITPEGMKDANLKKIPKGTFLFAITGLEAAGTRGSCAITGIDATTNQSCMALYPKKDKLLTQYLFHYYVRYGSELAFKFCQGTKQQSYTAGLAKRLPIILPPSLPEQTAIATALSDMDALIAQTEKLVEKKKAIRQGMMQQLLSPYDENGKLKEGWVNRKMGDLGEVKMCRRVFNSETKSLGEVPFYKIGTFGKEPDAFISIRLYNEYRYRFSFPKKGDILISAAGTIGRTIRYDGSPAYFQDSNIVWIDNNEEVVSNDYLEYIFEIVKYDTEGGTIQRLYNNILKNTKFSAPTLPEQIAIATTLSDMDALIAQTEKLIKKQKAIKQSMMQSLLTGKIRIYNPEHEPATQV